MADITPGISRVITYGQPSHYTLEIESFSMLVKKSIERYESGEFEIGGHKWKLVLHPNGNKSKNVDDYISLYVMVDGRCLDPGWEVHASFSFSLLDQNTDNYLVIQETPNIGKRFHDVKHEWGIDRLVSLKVFKDPSNGYLVNDTCVFGAAICVYKATGKGEFLSMMKNPISQTYTWKIDNFSNLKCIDGFKESTTFVLGDYKWKIRIYPKGDLAGAGNSLSLYLNLADPANLPAQTRIRAEFTLRILANVSSNHKSSTGTNWFDASNNNSGWGWQQFISMADFYSPHNCYLKNNSCIVEAEVIVHGVVKSLKQATECIKN